MITTPSPTLTSAQRRWLNDPAKRHWLTWEVTVGFIKEFSLTPIEAAALLKQWINELSQGGIHEMA